MNFIWEAMASRLLELRQVLGPNVGRILVLDTNPSIAKKWWQDALSQSCDVLQVKSADDLNALQDQHAYELIIWTLPPVHMLQPPLAYAVWTKLRAHAKGFFIFVTPGPLSVVALNQTLGTQIPNLVLDLHDLGDQLAQTGWQRPMLQGQPLTIQYHKRQTAFEDWVTLGNAECHPLWPAQPVIQAEMLQTPLHDPVALDITVGLVYNGADRTVQQQYDDGTIAIPVNQIKKRT